MQVLSLEIMMAKNRTFNTLFMLSSVDGKISTGCVDGRDFDKDFPKINGLKEGLKQYYQLEQSTDINSFNTGRVMVKIGMNDSKTEIHKLPVNFIIVDNNHLTQTGIKNMIKKSKKLFLATSNKNHPAFNFKEAETIFYQNKINFNDLFNRLKVKYKMNRVTVQSGGTLNALLVRLGLIDRINLVIAPALIGGEQTSALIGGESLKSISDLNKIKTLKLKTCRKLKNSYLHLVYDVIN